MPLALDEFVKALEDSGIITSEALSEFLPPKAEPRDAEDLAQELVRQRMLTRFQAKEIWMGKGKRLVLGNYILLERVGSGGMGQVYLARHKRMDRVVAIKMLPAGMSSNASALARFEREVKAAARVSHPNIVAAHDADVADGAPFLVMEYIEGQNLAMLVRSDGPLSVPDAVNYIAQAAQGLQFAHKKGIVHRDIKPGNLLLDNTGTVKILDMGLARLEQYEPGAAELTATGVIVGTVDYMSPEQAAGMRSADVRSDIYSLGCTLYFLLTGDTLYGGDGSNEKIVAHRDHSIPSLRAERSDVPIELDLLFQRMVAKQPDDRFQSAGEVLAGLSELESSIRPSIDRGSSPGSGSPGSGGHRTRPATSDSTVNYFPTAQIAVLARRKLVRRLLAACGGALLLALASYGAMVNRDANQAVHVPQRAGTATVPSNSDPVGAQPAEPIAAEPPKPLEAPPSPPPPPPTDLGAAHWVLSGHQGAVYGLSFSPDGRWLASGSTDRTVRIWDLATGAEAKKLEGHGSMIRSVSFGGDSQHVLSGSNDRTLRLWDITSGAEVSKFEGHQEDVNAVALSRDGKWALSGCDDNEVILWDTNTRQPLKRYREHTHPVWSVAFHRDGEHLLSASSDQTIRMWRFDTQDQVQVFAGHTGQVMSIDAAAGADRFASAGLDGNLFIWDGQAAQPSLRLMGHKGGVRAVSLAADAALLLSGGYDKQLLLWDIREQRALFRASGHSEIIACVALSADRQWAAAAGGLLQGSDHAIRVWSLPTIKPSGD